MTSMGYTRDMSYPRQPAEELGPDIGDEGDYVERDEMEAMKEAVERSSTGIRIPSNVIHKEVTKPVTFGVNWWEAKSQTEANEMDELGYDLPQDPPFLTRLERFLKASGAFTSHRFEKEDLGLLIADQRRLARENANNEYYRTKYRDAMLDRSEQLLEARREAQGLEIELIRALRQLKLTQLAGERLLDQLDDAHEEVLLARNEIQECRDLLDKVDVDRADGLWQELADLVERYR